MSKETEQLIESLNSFNAAIDMIVNKIEESVALSAAVKLLTEKTLREPTDEDFKDLNNFTENLIFVKYTLNHLSENSEIIESVFWKITKDLPQNDNQKNFLEKINNEFNLSLKDGFDTAIQWNNLFSSTKDSQYATKAIDVLEDECGATIDSYQHFFEI